MRNLKKFLALVLAMMMTLSLMVTVNAADVVADFDDRDSVTEEFVEAVDVLNGMGVFRGYENGSFDPKGQITRAEVAAIVYRLATGDNTDSQAHLYADYNEFTDVTSDKWYAGYVNYCANAEWIKGYGNGKFGPADKVTGYQAAAMILRAVGYGKNGEFEGGSWQVQVANVTRSKYLLINVDKTTYANTLNAPATRELIAEILFQAAQIPTVTWTMLGGYNEYQDVLGVTDLNPSLGMTNYGLYYSYGIVLGNQATGETYTKIGFDDYGNDRYTGSYDYADTLSFATKSDLSLFGHEVKVWHDARLAVLGYPSTVYTMYDEAVLTAVVSNGDNSTGRLSHTSFTSDAALKGKLAQAAIDEGFTVEPDGNKPTASKAYTSDSFSHLSAARQDSIAGKKSNVFVLISNNPLKTVDVMIAVDSQVANIERVNNVSSTPTMSFQNKDGAGTKDDLFEGGALFKQSKVMNPDAIKLGQTVVVTKVTKNTKTDGDPVYWLDTPTKKVTGTVLAYDWDGATGTQKVTLDDGTVLERTIIKDDALVSGTCNVEDNSASGATEKLAYAQYEFLLDMQGNWVNARRVYGDSFLYGTYVDFQSEVSSSSFNYYLTGVTADGQVDTKQINSVNGTPITAADQVKRGTTIVSYRSTIAGNPSELIKKSYVGTLVDANGNVVTTNDGLNSYGYFNGTTSWTDPTTINASSIAMSVVQVKDGTGAGTAANPYLYLTEQTKFYVVEGYGTDNLKVTPYEGISAFKGDSTYVEINPTAKMPGTGFNVRSSIVYTQSDYMYSNSSVIAKQVDTIFLPASAVIRNGGNNPYFVAEADKAPNVVNPAQTTNPAKLYTLYTNGEKVTLWIDKDGQDKITTGNRFLHLAPTAGTVKKAADGNPIYTVSYVLDGSTTATKVGVPGGGTDVVAKDDDTYAAQFLGTTNNGMTALLSINSTLYPVNVANAKVVSFVKDHPAEGLADLDNLASVHNVTVCVVYESAGSTVVSAIYVTAVSGT